MSDESMEPKDLSTNTDQDVDEADENVNGSIVKLDAEEGDGGDTTGTDAAEEEGSSGEEDGQSEGESSDDSLDGTLDKCPICLRVFRQQDIGTPDSCEHCFCLKCIMEWAENVSTCPIDRKAFHSILVMDTVKGQVIRVEEVVRRAVSQDYDDFNDPTYCELCGCCDREERLLLCDECDMGYHLECLDPPLDSVPVEDWYCNNCVAVRVQLGDIGPGPSSSVWTTRARSRIPRTELSRRIMNRRRRDTSVSPPTDRCGETCGSTSRPPPRNRSISESIRRPPARRRKRKSIRSRSGSGKGKRRTRKRRTRKQRVAIERRPATSRGRLVQQLGIQPPRPGQVYVGLPSYRPSFTSTAEKSTSSTAIRTQRHQAGIAPLRIFATIDDLADCFEGSSDEEGGVGVARIQPIRIGDPRKRVLASANAQPATSINVLGPILSRQHILLQDKNIQIHSGDGRLVPSISVNPDKFLWSPNEKDDSSGYDSFGNKEGSPPRIQSHGTGNPAANGTNAPPSNSTNQQSNSNPSVSSNSYSHTQVSTSYSSDGNSSNFFPRRSSLGYNSNEASNTFEDFSGLDDHSHSRPGSSKKSSKDNDDEDDEFNIYSDIEDDPKPAAPRRFSLETENHRANEAMDGDIGGGVGESDTDDMVIDEAQAPAGIDLERESRSSVESIALPPSDFQPGLDDAESPVLPEAEPDSPLSIPLPDSTPPPSVRDLLNPEDEDTRELLFDENQDEEPKKDEYDPSRPLTDSEEEEDDEDGIPLPSSEPPPQLQNIIPLKLKSTPVESSSSSSSAGVGSSIPIPLANDNEGRRPTIQFSIPSRHRIFSMSSLMKRNKGVMKKESKGGSSISFQSEMSKAFSGRKGDEPGVSGSGVGPSDEKVSLVAEIFGSDEEEEVEVAGPIIHNENLQEVDGVPSIDSAVAADYANEEETPAVVESTSDVLWEGSKWKIIVEDPEPPVPEVLPVPVIPEVPTPPEEDDDDEVVVIGETPPEVQIIETPPPELEDITPIPHPNQRRRLERPPPPKERDEKKKEKSPLNSVSDSENEFERQRLREKRLINRAKKDEEKKRKSKSPKRDKDKENKKATTKRRRSLSQSNNNNCEEGEILDNTPDKRRKKSKKSKKSKRRHRESRSRSFSSPDAPSFGEKKIRADTHGQMSSDDEKDDKEVSWKKPSKSSKERNYRDGKPKTEEKYFREREKKQEDEAEASVRNREKTPPPLLRLDRGREDVEKDRERGERRGGRERSSRRRSRSHGNRTHSRHSNKSSGSFRNNRSRSGSRSRRSRSSKSRRRPREYSPSPVHNSRLDLSPRSQSRKTYRQSRSPPPKRNQSHRRSRSPKSRQPKPRSHSSPSRSRSSSPLSRRRKREKISPTSPKRTSPKKSRKEPKEKKLEEIFRNESEIPNQVLDSSLVVIPPSGEKEKKKRKRKREKSISPAKAIFADGDSIVVSLNFQKGKEASVPKEDAGVGGNENTSGGEKKKGSRAGSHPVDIVEKPSKSHKKTILIDLESSPIQEQNIGVSPTLIVLSDDEDGDGKHRGNESDQDRLPSTTTLGEGGKSPFYRDGHGVPADSTQVQSGDGKGLEFGHGSENDTTPARGDALVTSTRDSVDRNGAQDEYTLSPSNSKDSNSPPEPRNTPPLPPGSPSSVQTSEKHAPMTHTHSHTMHKLPTMLPPLPNPGLGSRPLGLGLFTPNKPNLLPNPHPAIPQLRLPPPNIFNPSVLATVASALYGPLMGAQQRFVMSQQQQIQPNPVPSRLNWNPSNNNVIGKKQVSGGGGGSVLLPKDQNYGTQRRTGDGDSPFSPNSSDGDDLFEPPKDSNSSKIQGVQPVQRIEKSGGGDGDVGSKKSRGTSHVFDSLFGGPIKKPTSAAGTGANQPKPHKVHKHKSSGGHRSKSRRSGHKKAAPKASEGGELRISEEGPTSAVDLRVQEKYQKKLNRQERVVEEVKVSLKPYYSQKRITKEEYKDILRKAVPKICHNKSGEINPVKIKGLIEAYVKKIRKAKKKQA